MVGKVGFSLVGGTGQLSHTNELEVASTISSRLLLRRLKDIGREQRAHIGQGLYMRGTVRLLHADARFVSLNPDAGNRELVFRDKAHIAEAALIDVHVFA